MEKPHREEIAEWQSHPVTKYYLWRLKQDREEIKEAWANGELTAEDVNGTLQLNSSAVGSAQSLYSMIVEIEDMGLRDA